MKSIQKQKAQNEEVFPTKKKKKKKKKNAALV